MSRTIQHKSTLSEIKAILEFFGNEIMLWRLKQNFVNSTGKDYESAIEIYKETIEDKADKMVPIITKNRDAVKIQQEIELIKQDFYIKMATRGIEYLETEVKKIQNAAEANDAYGIITSVRHGPDFERKVNLLHNFINTMKNRATVVSSPGGKTLVYTIKDLSTITKRFADQLLRFKDTETKEFLNKIAISNEELISRILLEEKTLIGYQKSREELDKDIKNMVRAKITQKGAQIMYEIDVSQRQLKEIKENARELEVQVKQKIIQEYQQILSSKIENLDDLKQKFNDYKLKFSEETRNKLENSKADGIQKIKKFTFFSEKNEDGHVLESKSNKNSSVIILQEAARKIRMNYQWSRLESLQKYKKYINELKEQLTSTEYLHDQLNESKSRESLLKQELSYTQATLASTERLISKLQQQIKEMKSQQQSLEQYKVINSQRILELQNASKKYKNIEIIDSNKILAKCLQQDKQLNSIKYAELSPVNQYKTFHNKFQKEIERLKHSIRTENKILQDCVEQIKVYKSEYQETEVFEDREWKTKYLELLKYRKINSKRALGKSQNFTPDLSKSKIHPNYFSPQKS